MGVLMREYETIRVKIDGPICTLQLYRPDANNTINSTLAEECLDVVRSYRDQMNVLVVEGLPEVFCFGADFQSVERGQSDGAARAQDPEVLYNLWLDFATGPFISIAHVRGKANAGGMGFVAACDIVLADETAVFSLSELLFGLMPACVLPFLIRRVGFQKAHYMTLMTQPITVQKAEAWGLVDAWEAGSEGILRKHLLRLRRLSKKGVTRYKSYMAEIDNSLVSSKTKALAANLEVFSDTENLSRIARYVQTGAFPWE
jgi:polyketide biosynthesis enoyl-CoA hydratase PksH